MPFFLSVFLGVDGVGGGDGAVVGVSKTGNGLSWNLRGCGQTAASRGIVDRHGISGEAVKVSGNPPKKSSSIVVRCKSFGVAGPAADEESKSINDSPLYVDGERGGDQVNSIDSCGSLLAYED